MSIRVRFKVGEKVAVSLIWPYDMSSVWTAGYEVVSDDDATYLEVKGPDGVIRMAERSRVQLWKQS